MLLSNEKELTKLIAPVLDEAIARVAEQEFSRLREIKKNDDKVEQDVKTALDSLANLQHGDQPKFNEWDALFYLTWYQPRQINLALAILRKFYRDARKRQGQYFPLHIIDVGCGALPVQFAMAIIATAYQRDGNNLTVIGIDPSQPMQQIGKSLWLEFRSILSAHPKLSDLSRTCECMNTNYKLFDSHTSFYRSEGGLSEGNLRPECWIVVVHAIYESNKNRIKGALRALHSQYSPSVTLVTCHESKREIACFVAGEDFCLEFLNAGVLPFQGNLDKTTEWRKGLIDRLPENPLYEKAGLLHSSVEWAPDKSSAVLSRNL